MGREHGGFAVEGYPPDIVCVHLGSAKSLYVGASYDTNPASKGGACHCVMGGGLTVAYGMSIAIHVQDSCLDIAVSTFFEQDSGIVLCVVNLGVTACYDWSLSKDKSLCFAIDGYCRVGRAASNKHMHKVACILRAFVEVYACFVHVLLDGGVEVGQLLGYYVCIFFYTYCL